ncbi:MAG: N-acetyl-gamma-glutamyl-phosphate reductase [Nitrospiraceae bacterium]|nr:MAG: N-acetyl-gamma-glutamyl-phosphate reductase [Nitrospiraceae bacterium]
MTKPLLRVAVLGGSGYTGAELIRLLSAHPYAEVAAVTSERSAGAPVSDVFLHIRNSGLKFELLDLKSLIKKADLFFLCLPHKTSQETAAFLYNAGKKVIDLSADYRIKDPVVYQEWYNAPHLFPSLLKKSVYGLPEINRKQIRKASITANPGCYPVSAILGLAPIIGKNFIDRDSIIIDSKSGASGAGRSPAQPFMFCEVNDSVKAYAVTSHRHTPEIEQELTSLSKKKVNIIFTPHLMPMDRGILSTIYVRLKKKVSLGDVNELYRDFYGNELFVRVLGNGIYPSTKAVKGSNFCDLSIFLNKRAPVGQTLIVVSAIDNLLKGASGTAVQNMNIMYGFEESAGLLSPPYSP